VGPVARLWSRETAHHSALGIDLQNAASHSVGHEKEVVRRDHQAKWMS